MTDRELLEQIAGDVTVLKEKVDVLNNRTTRIELTLENDVAKKINIIGEGHGVLDRRFQESQVIPSRVENLELKMIHLETEIEKLKAAQ